MLKTSRIGWIVRIDCDCNPAVVHIITESEARDKDGELVGTITCNFCGKPLLAIGDDDNVYLVGRRLL